MLKLKRITSVTPSSQIGFGISSDIFRGWSVINMTCQIKHYGNVVGIADRTRMLRIGPIYFELSDTVEWTHFDQNWFYNKQIELRPYQVRDGSRFDKCNREGTYALEYNGKEFVPMEQMR